MVRKLLSYDIIWTSATATRIRLKKKLACNSSQQVLYVGICNCNEGNLQLHHYKSLTEKHSNWEHLIL